MKRFIPSAIQQLTKNVFVFKKGNRAILFNRINFDVIYPPSDSFSVLIKAAEKMEKKTPVLRFQGPPLKKIRVEVNFTCNLNCDYCLVFKNQLAQIGKTMSLSTAKMIVNFYKRKIKGGSVMISGGEPFLNWPVVKFFIEEIKDPIKIFTNGTILNDKILQTLKKSPHVRVMISLDGHAEDNKSRKFKNGKEVYYNVLRNLRTFKKNEIKIGIASVCTERNVRHLSKNIKFFFKNLKVNYIGINFPHFTKKNLFNVDMKEYASQLINSFDFTTKNKIRIDQIAKRFSPLLTKKFRYYACKLLKEQITFYPDGRTTFCSKIDTLDSAKKYNLNYFTKVIPINNSFCKNCPAIGICGGGCFWDGLTRFTHGVDERECILNKILLDYFLWKIREAKEKGISPFLAFRHFLE